MPIFPGAQHTNINGTSFTEVHGSIHHYNAEHNYNAEHGNISVQHGNIFQSPPTPRADAQSYPPSRPPIHARFASMSQPAAGANHDVGAQDPTRAQDSASQRWRQSFPMNRPAPADPEVRESAENDGGRAGARRRRGGSALGRRRGRGRGQGGRGGNAGTGGMDLNQEEPDQVQDAVNKTAMPAQFQPEDTPSTRSSDSPDTMTGNLADRTATPTTARIKRVIKPTKDINGAVRPLPGAAAKASRSSSKRKAPEPQSASSKKCRNA